MGAITGKRIARTHTTAIDLAGEVALMLDKCDFITKISLGIITARAGTKTRKIVALRDAFNLKITIQQPPAKQELYVSAPDREQVIAHLKKWCKEHGIDFTDR